MENKKTKIVSIIAIIALVLTLITATYAYFAAQTGEGAQTDIKINASTVDTFTFATGSALNLNLNQQNFASGAGNQTGTTYAKAMLTANNKTNTATEHYYLYLNISENTFTYTQDTNTPEILLSIKDNSNNKITSVSGLTYKTVTDGKGTSVSGFDITTKSDLITIFDNREITTTSSKEENWNVTITFVNYDADQSANAGKSFSAKLMIQKEKILTLANYVTSLYTGTQGDNNIYYHDSTLANGAGDNSYRYAGGENGCYYKGKQVEGGDLDSTSPNVASCQKVYSLTLGGKRKYVDSKVTSTYTDEKEVTWNNGACETKDGESVTSAFDENGAIVKVTEKLCKGKSYKMFGRITNMDISYAGTGTWKSEVNNFVCFGSNETTCPTDNLYRIIGVFDGKVKLIKYTYATSELLGINGDYNGVSAGDYKFDKYYWNYKNDTSINNGYGSNIWSTSLLNKTNLNTNYLNNLGTSWPNIIENTTWKVSGNSTYHGTSNEIYTAEITNATKTYGPTDGISKIGLMYVSDFGYAANPSVWATTFMGNMNNLSESSVNWMYMGIGEWTISPDSSDSSYVYQLGNELLLKNASSSTANGIRPVFYLKSSVTYKSGTGTQSDPIIIN